MNRRLKKLLKQTYGSEMPNRKFSFIQQLRNNPAWRNLHPISSVFSRYIVVKPIFAVLATMAVVTGIIAYNFNTDKNPKPDIPPVITVTSTSSTSVTAVILSETVVTSAVVTSVSENTVSSQTSFATGIAEPSGTISKENHMTTKPDIIETIPAESITQVQTAVQTTVRTDETESTSTTIVTSVYYTHFFCHDYTAQEADDDKKFLYGYPDCNLFEDIFRIMYERNNPDGDWEKEISGMTTADFSQAMINLLLDWDAPDIVEGEITSLEYISYEGKPWTICEIMLTEVYNSKTDYSNPVIMQKGDKIKIAMAGGYMPVSQYIELNPNDTIFSGWTEEQIDSTVIYEDGSNQSEIKIGDSYLYFLNESELDIPIENLYTRELMCDIAQFRKNDDKYISCNSYYPDFSVYSDRLENLSNYYDVFYDPDSDRCIAFKNESILLYGAFSCYSMNSDGRLTSIDYISTDDGYYPFHDDKYEFSRDELGRPVVIGEDFTMTWTDSGVILECGHYDFNKTVKIDYPKT